MTEPTDGVGDVLVSTETGGSGELESQLIEPLEWSVHLGRENRSKQWIVAMGAGLAFLFGTKLLNPFIGFLGAGVVVASTSEMFFPIKYRLDQNGASSKCGFNRTFIYWSDVQRIEEGETAVNLSPLRKSSRLDAFRGVYLRLRGNRDEVLVKIAELKENERTMDRGTDSRGGGQLDH